MKTAGMRRMSKSNTAVMDPVKTRKNSGSTDFSFAKQWQIVLYDDKIHSCDEVVKDLQDIFGHPLELAKKLVRDIGAKGRDIVHVCDREQAIIFKESLQSAHYTCQVEQIN